MVDGCFLFSDLASSSQGFAPENGVPGLARGLSGLPSLPPRNQCCPDEATSQVVWQPWDAFAPGHPWNSFLNLDRESSFYFLRHPHYLGLSQVSSFGSLGCPLTSTKPEVTVEDAMVDPWRWTRRARRPGAAAMPCTGVEGTALLATCRGSLLSTGPRHPRGRHRGKASRRQRQARVTFSLRPLMMPQCGPLEGAWS